MIDTKEILEKTQHHRLKALNNFQIRKYYLRLRNLSGDIIANNTNLKVIPLRSKRAVMFTFPLLLLNIPEAQSILITCDKEIEIPNQKGRGTIVHSLVT